MNKFGMALIAILMAPLAHAGNFVCEGALPDNFTLKVEGRLIGEWIKDIKATANQDGEVVVGRAAQLDRDENYKPRKYKNHYRFDLTKLTETENFGRYEPADECYLSFLVPMNAMKKNQFAAPVIANCDQSGGSFTLSCTHDRSVDRN